MTTETVINAYPYVQFSDDEDIVAWFEAHNQYTQQYLDWFNNYPLAIYTNDDITGGFLDWIGYGIYGTRRAPINTSLSSSTGAINTYTPNWKPINATITSDTGTFQTMTDETYRRLITWNFYKGDGMQLTIPWIKRRIARFISGGTGYIDTSGISVTITDGTYDILLIATTSDEIFYAQQISSLITAGIPNWPIGYGVNIRRIDTSIRNDFG